ncbi:hypothetical protein GSU3559 [Geobacter sulfurreducens PCA]|uniref:Uncharacterized protein n=1 Tax=Geobacter sulfurreducens (strain ATCC 51573 / DSM 12127 / PCA) TaxID=243231 RepID=I7FIG0_GEOSL|nr:hypothetical protein GSU3559 [Geobacter sulfurreducens PCA]
MRTLLLLTIYVLLLSFVTMFSGVTLMATAESPPAIGVVSNNHCIPDRAQSCPLPCTTPVCHFCVCAVADTVQPVEIQTTFQIVEFEFPDFAQSIPDPYVNEIFHPPRLKSGFLHS